MATDFPVDVRTVVPRERHALVFAKYQELAPGQSLVLIADHDPQPLRRQFETKHLNEFSWDYLEQGPVVWRVRIGRQA